MLKQASIFKTVLGLILACVLLMVGSQLYMTMNGSSLITNILDFSDLTSADAELSTVVFANGEKREELESVLVDTSPHMSQSMQECCATLVVGGTLTNVFMVKEWLRWHQRLGISSFYVFLLEPQTQFQLDLMTLAEQFPLRISRWNASSEMKGKDCSQDKCRYDFVDHQETIYRYALWLTKPHCRWLTFTDVDEFITPLRSDFSWLQFLQGLSSDGIQMMFLRWMMLPLSINSFETSTNENSNSSPSLLPNNSCSVDSILRKASYFIDPVSTVNSSLPKVADQVNSGKSVVQPSAFQDMRHPRTYPGHQAVYLHYFPPLNPQEFSDDRVACPSYRHSDELIFPHRCGLGLCGLDLKGQGNRGRRLENEIVLSHLRRSFAMAPEFIKMDLPQPFTDMVVAVEQDLCKS